MLCRENVFGRDIRELTDTLYLLAYQGSGAFANVSSNIGGVKHDRRIASAWRVPIASGTRRRRRWLRRLGDCANVCSVRVTHQRCHPRPQQLDTVQHFFVRQPDIRHLERQPRDSAQGIRHGQDFLSHRLWVAMNRAPVGPRWASKLDWLGGAKPRSLPIAPNISA